MSLRRHLPNVLELTLALVLAFLLGRLSVDTSSPPQPGTVDVGFSQDMAVHHEQAVLMATLAQTHGGPAVAAIGASIVSGQSQEIGLTRGWLRLWGRPAVDPHPMAWLAAASMPGMTMTTMPGMATSAQLTRLASLDGRRFDVLFLQLMIRHHLGGLQMCQYARAHAKLAVVRDAAASMAVEQIEDLGQMRGLLKADGGTELPPP